MNTHRIVRERQHLLRLCAERIIRNHLSGERRQPPHVLAEARRTLRETPPLREPISAGEPEAA